MATLVVGVALIGASLLLVRLQRESLEDNVEATIRLRASDVASALAGGAPPESVTVSDDEIALVQILDAAGLVVGSSPNIRGHEPVIADRPAAGRSVSRRVHELPIEDDPYEVLARSITTSSGTYTILVAGSLEDVEESIESLVGFLRAGVPLLMVAVAAGAWLVVGRALSPVEAIRREVAEIGAGDLTRRVPQSGANDEIARLAQTMNEMLARIEAAYARQDEFVADAAHELRSPLATMRAQIEVDLADLEDPGASATAAGLHDEVLRMQRLTDDLLLLARNGAANMPRLELVDLDDLVLDEARRIRSTAQIEIVTAAVSAAQVRGDANQLSRAVRNLIENASRYARNRVVLELTERHGHAVLTVMDDGPGVPPEDHARIFERFARTGAARARDDGGAGLGLAITKTIVEGHLGTIAVDVDLRDGARFVMTIPCARDVPARPRPQRIML